MLELLQQHGRLEEAQDPWLPVLDQLFLAVEDNWLSRSLLSVKNCLSNKNKLFFLHLKKKKRSLLKKLTATAKISENKVEKFSKSGINTKGSESF